MVGHFLQQRVADGVAEGVVHQLELIEIEEHDRGRGVMPFGMRQGDVDAVAEEQPVGQAGQGVVVRLILHLLLCRLPVGDVDDGPLENAAVEQGHVFDDPDRRSVAAPHFHFDVGERAVLSHLRHQTIPVFLGVVDRVGGLRQKLFAVAIAEHPCDGVVAVEESAVDRAAVNTGEVSLEEKPVALLALTQPLFGTAPLGDVDGNHQPRPPPAGDEFEGDDLGVEDVTIPFAMFEHARLVAVAARRERAAKVVELLRRTDLFDRHPQEFVLAVAVVLHGRLVHGDERQRLVVVNPHRQRIALKQRPVAMFAFAQCLFRAPPLGDVGCRVDDADRDVAVVPHKRRGGQDVDAHAGSSPPGHVLLEHAEAVEELAGGEVLLGGNNAADVFPDQRRIGIAEHRRCRAVGHADLAVEIDDDHGSFHRGQDLPRRVLRRQLGEPVAPDGVRGDGDEGEDGDEAERKDVDADRGEKLDAGKHGHGESHHQRSGPLTLHPLARPCGSPEQPDGKDEHPREDHGPGEVVRRSDRVVAPVEVPYAKNDVRCGQLQQRDGAAEDPAEEYDVPQGAPAADVRGSEVEDGGGEDAREGARHAGEGEGVLHAGRAVHQRETAQPPAGADGDDEEEIGDQGRPRPCQNDHAEGKDGRRREQRGHRQRAGGSSEN